MAAIVKLFSNWAFFHHKHFEIGQFHQRDANGWVVEEGVTSQRKELSFLHHKVTGALYSIGDHEQLSMLDMAKKNVLVGFAMGFSNWYFWGLAMKDMGLSVYHTAKGANAIWKAYSRESVKRDFNQAQFVSTVIPEALHPAFHHGVHAVKNFGMYTFLSAVCPTIFTYNVVVGTASALYGMRNPLNFRHYFTEFENWWTADVTALEQNRVTSLTGFERLKGFMDTTLKLHQVVFPEQIQKVENPFVDDAHRHRQYTRVQKED